MPPDKRADLMKKLDTDGDGRIDLEEFRQLFKHKHSEWLLINNLKVKIVNRPNAHFKIGLNTETSDFGEFLQKLLILRTSGATFGHIETTGIFSFGYFGSQLPPPEWTCGLTALQPCDFKYFTFYILKKFMKVYFLTCDQHDCCSC